MEQNNYSYETEHYVMEENRPDHNRAEQTKPHQTRPDQGNYRKEHRQQTPLKLRPIVRKFLIFTLRVSIKASTCVYIGILPSPY